MKLIRTIISLTLVLCLCLSLCGLPAAAASDFVVTDGVLLAYYGPGGHVDIPDGVTSIGERVFYKRADVTGVTIPDGVTSIGPDAFYSCPNLAEVSFPKTLTTIGRHAFDQCFALHDISLPSSLTTLSDHAFMYCSGLTEVTIPGSVKVVGEYAFYGCSSLTDVTLRYGVERIDFDAFGRCPSLSSLTIPSSVTFMDAAIFTGPGQRFVVYGYNDSTAKAWTIKNTWQGAEFVALDDRNPFTDVTEPDYFMDPVLWAVEQKITDGTTATTFSPLMTCTTAHILTFLWRANGAPAVSIPEPFTNVSETDYYYGAVRWAYSMGMIPGGTFHADEPCTRAATVMFLWQAAGMPTVSSALRFGDVPADSAYAPAVAWAVEQGVTDGTGGGMFSPDAICNRAQIVTFLYRAVAEA